MAGQLSILHRFSGGPEGGDPVGPLARDRFGNLYGVADQGGAEGGGGGNGVVFQLSERAPGRWRETVLLRFPASGGPPGPGITRDRSGALYGSVPIIDQTGAGIVYRLIPPTRGPVWSFHILHTFPGGDARSGSYPSGGLLLDSRGDVFGTTQAGGSRPGPDTCACGVAYELSPPAGSGEWHETVLHAFRDPPDAGLPAGGLTLGPDEALFGTSSQGGTGDCLDGSGVGVIGCGTVYRLEGLRGAWTEQVLYDFGPAQENAPADRLTVGPDGAFYGIAGLDVYRLVPPNVPGGTWRHQVLYEFQAGIAGTAPAGAVVFDRNGALYGVTRSFGLDGTPALYRLAPPATRDAPWLETTLATFPKGRDFGAQPSGAVVLGPDGTVYGTLGAGHGQNGYVFAYRP